MRGVQNNRRILGTRSLRNALAMRLKRLAKKIAHAGLIVNDQH